MLSSKLYAILRALAKKGQCDMDLASAVGELAAAEAGRYSPFQGTRTDYDEIQGWMWLRSAYASTQACKDANEWVAMWIWRWEHHRV